VVSTRLVTRTDKHYMLTADAAQLGHALAVRNEAIRGHIAGVGGSCAVERCEAPVRDATTTGCGRLSNVLLGNLGLSYRAR
jgi:hypothetical protein